MPDGVAFNAFKLIFGFWPGAETRVDCRAAQTKSYGMTW